MDFAWLQLMTSHIFAEAVLKSSQSCAVQTASDSEGLTSSSDSEAPQSPAAPHTGDGLSVQQGQNKVCQWQGCICVTMASLLGTVCGPATTAAAAVTIVYGYVSM